MFSIFPGLVAAGDDGGWRGGVPDREVQPVPSLADGGWFVREAVVAAER